MAVNHFVAFSRSVVGVGVVAGAPYGCNTIEGSDDKCGSAPASTRWSKLLPRLAAYMHRRANQGLIDPLASLRGKRVFLFSGQADWVVARGVMRAVKWQLSKATGAGTVQADFGVNAAHGWVVDGATCGPGPPGSPSSWCATCCCSPSSLLQCEGHDLAGRLLKHVHATAASKRGQAAAPLISVPQAPYVADGRTLDDSGLWHTAYIYAPWRCRAPGVGGCKIHVHYHGCVWGAEYTGTDILTRLGLAEWAESLGMVVVFPQTSSTVDEGGCWDWTGKTGPLFDTRWGAQLRAVTALLRDLPRILEWAGRSEQIAV